MRITLISAFLLVACNGGEQGTTGTPVTAAGTASTATTPGPTIAAALLWNAT